jgi:ribonuclease R
MQDKIGEVYEGTVAGVTSFGVFVALDGVYVEGLLHVTELGNDYFNYDKARHEMVGERTGVRFRLGDRLTIKVARVDLETSKIDFTLVSHASHLPVHKTAALQASIHEPSGDAQKKTLNVSRKNTNNNANAEFKPLSTRALEKAKHDRTGKHKNATKTPAKSASKQRTKNTKNKGKPKR